jgi:outer membrane protein
MVSKRMFDYALSILFRLNAKHVQKACQLGITCMMGFSFWGIMGTAGNIYAQQAVSLSQAVAMGLEQQPVLAKLLSEKDLAQLNAQRVRDSWLPQVNASFDLRANPVLPTSILPGTLRGRPASEQIAVQFGTTYNASLVADVQWALFDPARRTNGYAAALQQAVADQNIAQQRLLIAHEVRKSYYAIILAQRQLQLLSQTYRTNEKLYQDLKAKAEQQQAVPTDVDRAYLEAENTRLQVAAAQQTIDLNLSMLKFHMGMDQNQNVRLSDTNLLANSTTLPPMPAGTGIAARAEYQNLRLAAQQLDNNINAEKRGYYPRVSLYGQGATQAFRNEFNFFDTQQSWFPIVFGGVRVEMSIFDAHVRRNKIAEYRLGRVQKNQELASFTLQFDKELSQSRIKIKQAEEQLKIWENNLKIANSLSALSQERFIGGQIPYRDVLSNERTILDTRSNYLTALYNLAIARLEMLYSLGVVTE